MRPPRSLVDIFEDCVSRLAAGQSLEACLALYPDHAARLRPLLENVETLSALRVPQAELVEDQALVWNQIMRALPETVPQRRGGYRGLLLAAILLALLLSLIGATWFVLTRPDLPREDQQMIIPPTETALPALPTVSATLSATLTLTTSPSATPTPTPTVTPSRTPTATASASHTPTQLTPAAATAVSCDGPVTLQGAISMVNALYPSATVTSAAQKTLPNGASVWLITTNQRMRISIDAVCGLVLNIEQISGGIVGSGRGSDGAGQNANTSGANNNANSAGGNDNSSGSSGGSANDNTNRNDDSSSGRGSGSGGDDDNNDNDDNDNDDDDDDDD